MAWQASASFLPWTVMRNKSPLGTGGRKEGGRVEGRDGEGGREVEREREREGEGEEDS
jgi:hypothetical protein